MTQDEIKLFKASIEKLKAKTSTLAEAFSDFSKLSVCNQKPANYWEPMIGREIEYKTLEKQSF